MMQSVSSASTSQFTSAVTSSSSEVSKDQFLKLLTYQLKAQNPMKPYDNQEFASQLAQFSQLEQLSNIKTLIEEQISSNNSLTQVIANSALPGLIGKNAKALSSTINYDGETKPQIGFSLPYNAVSGQVQIKDTAGNLVRTIDLSEGSLSRGDHDIIWDGEDQSGKTVSEGNYKFSVTLKDEKGSSFTADTYSTGEIQAVRFKTEGTVLVINGTEVSLDKISDITMGN
ncbi:MAG: flagellar basal-body rod modification protein FlgD [Bacteroidota bacterium]|nr:flagellar basal-body rod modification protein FlgD [Bacteroidota bacterium]